MTTDLDDRFGVTVHHARKLAARAYVADAVIFGRDTHHTIVTVTGEGATRAAAEASCMGAARAWVAMR